ncbi:MAG TPA: SulP family inorganic anion transporter [Burkholderiales bacterium]
MKLARFHPRLLQELRAYDGAKFAADLGAGITVGLVALPLAIAFGIASGVKPEDGLFTAIIAGFLISALGGSRVQIGGPAGAFIVITYGILHQYGLANLLIATMMAGVLLFLMGLTGVGALVRFIPVAVVIGFSSGIAVLIAVSQVRDFLGLEISDMPAEFFAQVGTLARAAGTLNWIAVCVGLVSLLIVAAWPRVAALAGRAGMLHLPGRSALVARTPGTIVALVVTTVAVAWFHLPVETIGSRFGGIPQSLPAFAFPTFDWATARMLVAPTITIAILVAVESLLCARVADSMINDRHDSNQELMAQGIANFVTPLFGGIPATGTFARTSTNVRSGARTPLAGMIHAVTLLAIVLVAAPLAAHIPLATLAGILLFVAFNMADWSEFRRLRRFSVNYRIVMLSTFSLTIVFGLSVAVEVGMVLASLLFIYRISEITRIEPLPLPETGALERADSNGEGSIAAYKLFGSLFFGTVGKLDALLDARRERMRVLVLEMHQVINLDTSGLDFLQTLQKTLREEGRHVVLAGLNEQPASLLRRSGFLQVIGESNVVTDLPAAFARARDLAAHSR